MVGPIEVAPFLPRLDKGARDPADVTRFDCMFIAEHDARMMDTSLPPANEQWQYCFQVISDESQTLLVSGRQDESIRGSHKPSIFPMIEAYNGYLLP
jgi:hypothetical protein